MKGEPLMLAENQASLLVYGNDRQGLVGAVAQTIAKHNANIVSLHQYSEDPRGGAFFQRTVMTIDNFQAVRPALEADLEKTLEGLGLEFTLRDMSVPKRVAILASKSDHCLLDLLWRQRRGTLPVNVSMVVSNYAEHAESVRSFGVPFFHVPSVAGPDKTESEQEIVKLLAGNVDFVVLARYMQILSPKFIDEIGVPIINIHHSFLPAFIGAGPYARAKERGVKLIGATAHYVTDDLDEGPIIEQDVVRVTHADSAEDLQRRGADVERAVLSRAVQWHSEDRVIRHGNHTIVFN